MKVEIKEKFYSLEELKRTIDCYDGYLDNEEVYYFIGALRFAYDYITNLQEEIEKLNNDKRGMLVELYKANDEKDKLNKVIKEDRKFNECRLKEWLDYKSRNERAKSLTNRTIEIIKQQPSGNDEWILERLNGINYCLGSDE